MTIKILMTLVNNQDIFRLNQEFLSLSATTPKIHGKVECFKALFNGSKVKSNKNNNNLNFIDFNSQSKNNYAYGQNWFDYNEQDTLNAASQHFDALVQCFSEAFPDFDFSTVHPWNFKLIQSPEQAQSDMVWKFQSVLPDSDQFVSHIWSFLDKEMNPGNCSIYIYESDRPDAFSAMGAVFNLSYFILNEKMNRVLLIHMREGANDFGSESDDELNEFNDDFEGNYFTSY